MLEVCAEKLGIVEDEVIRNNIVTMGISELKYTGMVEEILKKRTLH
jgi:hypothetical protein